MPVWNPSIELLDAADLRALQVQRLRDLVAYAEARVPFYRAVLAAERVTASNIRSLDDLRRLPFTTKADLRDHYPFGLFAVPVQDVARIHASSGTTGKPTVAGYTRGDLALWGEVMARALSIAGVTASDVVHNAYGYGLFTGGLGVHIGAERIGATVVPVSGGMTKRQVMLLEDFGATVLTCTPSYALVIAEEAAAQGIDVASRLRLRVGVFGAEPWTESMRRELESKLGIRALNIYGLTEIIGPGVAQECEHACGMHLFEDVFLPEIVDPDSGEVLPPGEEGELVLTTLTKEAMPVIRYRTRDRTRFIPDRCACGRTLVRMERIMGRTDDMLIVRGVNVFPQLIEHTLLSIEDLEPQYQIVVQRAERLLDTLEVHVEGTSVLFQEGSEARRASLGERVTRALTDTLGVSVTVRIAEPRSLPRSEGKARRVIDRRELDRG
jgi:phenylacetate-CoA ligase